MLYPRADDRMLETHTNLKTIRNRNLSCDSKEKRKKKRKKNNEIPKWNLTQEVRVDGWTFDHPCTLSFVGSLPFLDILG